MYSRQFNKGNTYIATIQVKKNQQHFRNPYYSYSTPVPLPSIVTFVVITS